MARQLRIEYEGATYHITARGNERKKIFSPREIIRSSKNISLLPKNALAVCFMRMY